MKKKIITMLLVAAMLTSGSAMLTAGAAQGTTIIYDGQSLSFDVEPVNIDGTILVPMRAIFETFGAKVKWDGTTMTVTAKKGSKVYTMTIGESTITLTRDDEVIATVAAEQALQIIDGRTMMPLRALSELLGLDVSWDGDSQTVTITTPEDESDDSWKENTGVIDVTSLTTDSDGVSVSGKVITITKGGDYTVTGTNADAQIVVDTEDKVKLRLSGVELTNTDGAAIYVKSADKCYITVTDGTVNTLTDGGEYTDDSETNAVIYSKDDLEIKGKGTLTINGTRHNGITAKDDLSIENGNIVIAAVADAIHVNDTAAVSGGSISITAGEDGIQSESVLDISGGDIDITCTGEVTESASSDMFGRGAAATTDTEDEDVSSKGLKAEWLMDISGGTIDINSNDTCIKCDSELDINGGTITLTSNSKKGIKGLEDVTINDGTVTVAKATEGIESKRILTINGGDISVTASDDGMNAGGGNTMQGGFGGMQNGNMQSGGMQQMTPPDMQNGDMQQMTPPDMQSGNMQQMTPPDMQNSGMQQMTPPDMQNGNMQGRGGMRGGRMQNGNMQQMAPFDMQNGDMQQMTPPDMQNGDMQQMTPPDMQNGDMQQMTPPDMQNSDTQNNMGGGMQGGFGGMRRESTTVSTEHHIEINGGNVYVNSQGDGIDSNGSLIINGGYVVVDGPTSSGNGTIDHDGLCQVNGGTLIAIGAAGMVETPASSSAQNTISAYISASAGDTVTVKDSAGNEILSYTAKKNAGHIMYSSDEIRTGGTYTVYVNGNEQGSGTISAAVTTIGTQAQGMQGGFGQHGNMQRGTAAAE